MRKLCFQCITYLLIVTFLFQDISWAGQILSKSNQRDTVAPQSIFQYFKKKGPKLSDVEVGHIWNRLSNIQNVIQTRKDDNPSNLERAIAQVESQGKINKSLLDIEGCILQKEESENGVYYFDVRLIGPNRESTRQRIYFFEKGIELSKEFRDKVGIGDKENRRQYARERGFWIDGVKGNQEGQDKTAPVRAATSGGNLKPKNDYAKLRKYLQRELENIINSPGRIKKYFGEKTVLFFMQGSLQEEYRSGRIKRGEVIDLLIQCKKIEDIFVKTAVGIYKNIEQMGIKCKFSYLTFYYNPEDYQTWSKGVVTNTKTGMVHYSFAVNVARLMMDKSKVDPRLMELIMVHELGHIIFEVPDPATLTEPGLVIPLMIREEGIDFHPYIKGLKFDFLKYDPVTIDVYSAVNELIANWFVYNYLSGSGDFGMFLEEIVRQNLDNYEYAKRSQPEVEINTEFLAQCIALAEFTKIEKGPNLKKAEGLLAQKDLEFVRDLKSLLERLKLKSSPLKEDAERVRDSESGNMVTIPQLGNIPAVDSIKPAEKFIFFDNKEERELLAAAAKNIADYIEKTGIKVIIPSGYSGIVAAYLVVLYMRENGYKNIPVLELGEFYKYFAEYQIKIEKYWFGSLGHKIKYDDGCRALLDDMKKKVPEAFATLGVRPKEVLFLEEFVYTGQNVYINNSFMHDVLGFETDDIQSAGLFYTGGLQLQEGGLVKIDREAPWPFPKGDNLVGKILLIGKSVVDLRRSLGREVPKWRFIETLLKEDIDESKYVDLWYGRELLKIWEPMWGELRLLVQRQETKSIDVKDANHEEEIGPKDEFIYKGEQNVLVFDIDGTIHKKDEVWSDSNHPVRVKFEALLALGFTMALISNNDITNINSMITNWIPEKLRKNLVVFSNAGARKFTYDENGNQVEDVDHYRNYTLPKEDLEIIQAVVNEVLRELEGRIGADDFRRMYPEYDGSEKPDTIIRGQDADGNAAQFVIKALPCRDWKEIKPNIPKGEDDERDWVLKEVKRRLPPHIADKLQFQRGKPHFIDINKKGVNKKHAMEVLINHLGVSKDKVLYFGDEVYEGGNDFSVLETGVKVIAVNEDQSTVPAGAFKGGSGIEATARQLGRIEEFTVKAGAVPVGGKTELSIPKMKGIIDGECVGILKIIKKGEKPRQIAGKTENEILAFHHVYDARDTSFMNAVGMIGADDSGYLVHDTAIAHFWKMPYAVVRNLEGLNGLDGKWVYMKVSGNNVVIRLATEDEIQRMGKTKYVPEKPELAEVDLNTSVNILSYDKAVNPKEVSHKFAALHKVGVENDAHFGSVVPFSVYRRVLDANPGAEEKIRRIIAEIDPKGSIYDILGKLVGIEIIIDQLSIPEDILRDWDNDENIAWAKETGKGLFIRTGTNAEDLPDFPGFGTGKYESFANVKYGDIVSKIKGAWASVWSFSAFMEREMLGMDHFSVYPAVQISKAVNSDYSFTINTVEPKEYDPNLLMIELIQGIGKGFESSGKPHRYIYDRERDRIVKYELAEKKEKFVFDNRSGAKHIPTDYADDIFVKDRENSEIALRLARLAVKVETNFGRPQDIEGGIKDGNVYIFQSRTEAGYAEVIKMVKEAKKYFDDVSSPEAGSYMYYWLSKNAANLHKYTKLFYSLGEDGKQMIKLIFAHCGSSHLLFVDALNSFDADLAVKILDLIAVDPNKMTMEQYSQYYGSNGFLIACLVNNLAEGHENKLKALLSKVMPNTLISIINELSLNTYFDAGNSDKILDTVRDIIGNLHNENRSFVIKNLSKSARDWLGIDILKYVKKLMEKAVDEFGTPNRGTPKYMQISGRRVRYLETKNIDVNDLPLGYPVSIRPQVSEKAFNDSIKVNFPEDYDVILVSIVHGGRNGVLVRLGWLNDGTPVAVKSRYTDLFDKDNEAILSEYEDAKVSDTFGIGPRVHGLFTDQSGRKNIVMDIIAGGFGTEMKDFINITTVRDFRVIFKRLHENGKPVYSEFQYFITSKGRMFVIDPEGLNSAKIIMDDKFYLIQLCWLLAVVKQEVQMQALEEIAKEDPELFVLLEEWVNHSIKMYEQVTHGAKPAGGVVLKNNIIAIKEAVIKRNMDTFINLIRTNAIALKKENKDFVIAVDTDIANLKDYAEELFKALGKVEEELRKEGFDNVKILTGNGKSLKAQLDDYLEGKKEGTYVINAIVKNYNLHHKVYENIKDKMRITSVNDADLTNEAEDRLFYVDILSIINISIQNAANGERGKITIINLELPKSKPLSKDELIGKYNEEARLLYSA